MKKVYTSSLNFVNRSVSGGRYLITEIIEAYRTDLVVPK